MKKIFRIIPVVVFIGVPALLSTSCENYGSDDIPVGSKDIEKQKEIYNSDTTGHTNAVYNPKDTVAHDKTQMQPANSNKPR